MKTTLNLDDSLYRRAKIKAFEEGRTVSSLIEEGLQLAMGGISPSPNHPQKQLPPENQAGSRE
jgi:hypothetical protein